MRERPIPFSPVMVKALLAGTKTMTRRVATGRIYEDVCGTIWTKKLQGTAWESGPCYWHCPYGKPPDRLWVREPWRTHKSLDHLSGSAIAAKCAEAGWEKPWAPIQYSDGARVNWAAFPPDFSEEPGRYRHARFMPRFASRLVLEVTAVRVERLSAITEEDARAEGVQPRDGDGHRSYVPARLAFAELWETLHGVGSWQADPFVWIIEFRKVA